MLVTAFIKNVFFANLLDVFLLSFSLELRAVKITTKFWELKSQPQRRILKRLTESLP